MTVSVVPARIPGVLRLDGIRTRVAGNEGRALSLPAAAMGARGGVDDGSSRTGHIAKGGSHERLDEGARCGGRMRGGQRHIRPGCLSVEAGASAGAVPAGRRGRRGGALPRGRARQTPGAIDHHRKPSGRRRHPRGDGDGEIRAGRLHARRRRERPRHRPIPVPEAAIRRVQRFHPDLAARQFAEPAAGEGGSRSRSTTCRRRSDRSRPARCGRSR
jgi:hypothetical protein